MSLAVVVNYWLMKTEPESYSIDDLQNAPDQTTSWDGVRNYQARNFMQSMDAGDMVLFYHSGKKPSVAGVAQVVREAYPDHTQFDPDSKYFDPKAAPDAPRWFMVDVRLVHRFPRPVPLARLRADDRLAGMVLLKKGNRLSVMPVAAREFEVVKELGEAAVS